jgi:predicted ABC-type ATPase
LGLPTASSRKLERPKFWIVAGPNGSGKSSIYADAGIEDFGSSVWIINPDLLAARIGKSERRKLRDANLEAVKRIYAWLEASIAAHQTVGVETVLSTDKYRALVLAARKLGFEIRLIYVLLKDVSLNIERIRLRVAKGGHAVPKTKIIERRERSLDQLPWFLQNCDKAWLYDNSGASPQLVGVKSGGVIELDDAVLPEIRKAAESIRTRK